MRVERTPRGFEIIDHPAYVPGHESCRLVQQSSAVGKYPDAFDRPGTSFLWFGDKHHLDREQVAELVDHLNAWLKYGSLGWKR